MDMLFQVSNLLVMPFWLLMILLPHWSWTKRISASPWISAPVALLYVILVVPNVLQILPMLAAPALSGVTSMLGTPQGAMIAWAHFLAFDLFVGRWAYLESRRLDVSAWVVSPILFLILMLGPLGMLVFLILRSASDSSLRPALASAHSTLID